MLHIRIRRDHRGASSRLSPARRRVAIPIVALMLIGAFVLNACSSSTSPGSTGAELWVANAYANTILGYSAAQIKSSTTEAPAIVIGTPPGSDGNPLGGNAAIAFDRSGNLWVAEDGTGPNTLIMYPAGKLRTSSTPTPALTITSAAMVDEPDSAFMGVPVALAFDAVGNLWVACEFPGSGSLLEFTPSQLGTSGNHRPAVAITTNNGSINVPQAIAFDRAGNLWLANEDDIVEFSVSQLASSGSPAPAITLGSQGQSNLFPSGLAFDHSGNLWVASHLGRAAYEFTPTQLLVGGTPAPATTLTAVGTSGGLNGAISIAFDPVGNLWVTSTTYTISEFLASQVKTSGAPSPAVTISGTAIVQPFSLAFRLN
jgi:sugar lactone lactonase YvrE